MARLALAIAYDGTRFDSFARQPGRRTVEGELLATLRRGGVLGDPGTTRFRLGSRTDRGVSAAWNVVAFDARLPAPAVVAATVHAPEGLHFLSATDVDADFDPRRAQRRTYRYFLEAPWNWSRVGPVAKEFLGRHDFSNFSRRDGNKPPVATLTSVRYRLRAPGPYVEFEAPYFLWHQVRRLVAAFEKVHDATVAPRTVREALRHPETRIDLGVAPPENLLLLRVDYAGIRFPRAPALVANRLDRSTVGLRRRASWLEATRGNLPTTRR